MNWTKKGLIYKTSKEYYWNKSHAQVPIVDILNSDVWRIYYSTRDKNNKSCTSYIEVEANNPQNISYINNAPIIEKGSIGSFDDCGTMPASILKINNSIYLYYIGWSLGENVPYRNSIGLAISTDNGVSFKKYSKNPIIGVGEFDLSFTGTIYVFKEEVYHGYYLSCNEWIYADNKQEPIYDIKYAKSKDGIYWERSGDIAIPLKKNEGGIVSASVIKYKNRYLMWYSYRKKIDYRNNKNNSYKIGFAKSKDLINWDRLDKDSGISLSEKGWDSEMIAYPNVIESNGKLYMFYNGNGFGKSGFGYAEMDLKSL